MPSGTIQDIEIGKAVVIGRNQDGSVIAQYTEEGRTPPKRVWNMKAHNAETYGTNIINMMIGKRFNYPKSIYAVHDVIHFFVANKPEALIIDFFCRQWYDFTRRQSTECRGWGTSPLHYGDK